jgi:hypothetical protein
MSDEPRKHCWAGLDDGNFHGTCMLSRDHTCPHQFTPDKNIDVTFPLGENDENVRMQFDGEGGISFEWD